MKIITVLLILAISTFIPEQNDLIFQLQGTWKVEGKQKYEQWVKEESALIGEGYKLVDGNKKLLENLQLQKIDGVWTYMATVPNQNNGATIPFTLKDSSTNKLSFENLNHDFPKKIQYEFVSEAEVVVSVLGDGDQGFHFKMTHKISNLYLYCFQPSVWYSQ